MHTVKRTREAIIEFPKSNVPEDIKLEDFGNEIATSKPGSVIVSST